MLPFAFLNSLSHHCTYHHTHHCIAGRIAESLVRGKYTRPFKTALYSLAGNQKMVEGDVVAEIVSGHRGIERFNQYEDLAAEVTEMVREQSHSLFGESYSSQLESTLMDTEALGAMLDDAVLKAGKNNIPKNYLVCCVFDA